MKSFTIALVSAATLLLSAGFAYVANLYTCPHFFIFPSTRKLAEEFVSRGMLTSIDAGLAGAQFTVANVKITCSQGSDDELEFADVSYTYSFDGIRWQPGKATVVTDFTLLGERKLVEIWYQNQPHQL